MTFKIIVPVCSMQVKQCQCAVSDKCKALLDGETDVFVYVSKTRCLIMALQNKWHAMHPEGMTSLMPFSVN